MRHNVVWLEMCRFIAIKSLFISIPNEYPEQRPKQIQRLDFPGPAKSSRAGRPPNQADEKQNEENQISRKMRVRERNAMLILMAALRFHARSHSRLEK